MTLATVIGQSNHITSVEREDRVLRDFTYVVDRELRYYTVTGTIALGARWRKRRARAIYMARKKRRGYA